MANDDLKRTNAINHLLDVIATGFPMSISITTNVDITGKFVETTGSDNNSKKISRKIHGKLQADFQKLKYELQELKSLHNITEADNTELRKQLEEPVKIKKRGPNLTKEQVWQIRRFVDMGRVTAWISNHMKISSSTVERVKNNKSYNHIPPEPKPRPMVVKPGLGVVKR